MAKEGRVSFLAARFAPSNSTGGERNKADG